MSINPNTFVSGLAQNTRLPQAPDQMNAVNQIMQAGLRQKEIAEMHAWRDRIIDAQEKARDATQFQSMFGPLLGQASQAQNQADYDKVNKNWDTMAKVFNKASSGHINPGSLSDFISGPGKQVQNSNNPFAAIMNWAGATPNTQAQQATGNVLAGMGKSAIQQGVNPPGLLQSALGPGAMLYQMLQGGMMNAGMGGNQSMGGNQNPQLDPEQTLRMMQVMQGNPQGNPTINP